MKVVVNRFRQSANSTIGTVEVNNLLKYYGMEPAKPIPAGTYNLVKYYSPKHSCYVPMVENVPGHGGVEIHAGNYPRDTKDCLLIASGYMQKDFISSSGLAVKEFYQQFFKAVASGEKCTITYLNTF